MVSRGQFGLPFQEGRPSKMPLSASPLLQRSVYPLITVAPIHRDATQLHKDRPGSITCMCIIRKIVSILFFYLRVGTLVSQWPLHSPLSERERGGRVERCLCRCLCIPTILPKGCRVRLLLASPKPTFCIRHIPQLCGCRKVRTGKVA